ncbi:aldo/keto reductase [Paenibacillus sp. FSL R7-0331]|uniref:aldo/keto reductase n=1 Tax=Paenibacillus sp. FSL R7-0331 TaxID=1536773 RepID=UPI0004F8CC4A|nr:aldo/keto reductase [Paenibacillus sp. FSL R7-0331]AIQ52004.1 glyoxal reductase [Paenibacillus sp. FSL R7-0331]
MKHLNGSTVLNNGVHMPWFGLGTFRAEGAEVANAVTTALELGYRSIDTAAVYGNEEEVGQSIASSGVARDSLFVTTKVWNSDQGYDTTLQAFDTSCRKLGLDMIDLYLIHWPGKDKYKDTWRALERLYEEGRVRAIGVSNFQIHHLEELRKDSGIVPAVNQVELHPRFIQKELHDYCTQHQIQIEAWAPLMKGRLQDNGLLQGIAGKHGKTVSQVILRWGLQNRIVIIPKSVTPSRIKENSEIFDFELTSEEISAISGLDAGERIGTDPDKLMF